MLGESSQQMTCRLGAGGSRHSAGWMTDAGRRLSVQGKQASLVLQWERGESLEREKAVL